MTPEQIKDVIVSTPEGIERANKAEELLETYKEDLKGKEAIGLMISLIIESTPEGIERAMKAEEILKRFFNGISRVIKLIIESTPEGIERAKKAEELLNKHIQDLKGKRIIDGRTNHDAIGWVIEKIIESTPEGIERTRKAEELLKRHIEDLKGVRIRGGVTAIEYMKNRITENRKQASSYTSYVDTQRQQNPKQTSCDIS